MSAIHNRELVKVLRRWTIAAQDAEHSSTQAEAFRKAALGLAAHTTPVTSREEALRVRSVGPKLSALIAEWLAWEASVAETAARRVASLIHDEEAKWWAVSVRGNTAWRSYGKREGGANRPGFDKWTQFEDEVSALRWAKDQAGKAIRNKGYTHAPGAHEMFDAVVAEVEAHRSRAVSRAVSPKRGAGGSAGGGNSSRGCNSARVWSRTAAAAGGGRSPPDNSHPPSPSGDTHGNSGNSGNSGSVACGIRLGSAASGIHSTAEKSETSRLRCYTPRLLDSRGQITPVAAVLIELLRSEQGPLSATELVTRVRTLCPQLGVTGKHTGWGGKGGGRGGMGRGRGRGLSGPMR